MSDIGPGDVVVCVDARPCSRSAVRFPYRFRGIYRVGAVWVNPPCPDRLHVLMEGEQPYHIKGDPWPLGWNVGRFRKLNDGEDDAELIERIKTCRPVRQGVPA